MIEHAQDAAERTGLADLPAEEQVGGDVERRGDGERLVHRLDAGGAGLNRAFERDRLTVEAHLARGRLLGPGQTFDQR